MVDSRWPLEYDMREAELPSTFDAAVFSNKWPTGKPVSGQVFANPCGPQCHINFNVETNPHDDGLMFRTPDPLLSYAPLNTHPDAHRILENEPGLVARSPLDATNSLPQSNEPYPQATSTTDGLRKDADICFGGIFANPGKGHGVGEKGTQLDDQAVLIAFGTISMRPLPMAVPIAAVTVYRICLTPSAVFYNNNLVGAVEFPDIPPHKLLPTVKAVDQPNLSHDLDVTSACVANTLEKILLVGNRITKAGLVEAVDGYLGERMIEDSHPLQMYCEFIAARRALRFAVMTYQLAAMGVIEMTSGNWWSAPLAPATVLGGADRDGRLEGDRDYVHRTANFRASFLQAYENVLQASLYAAIVLNKARENALLKRNRFDRACFTHPAIDRFEETDISRAYFPHMVPAEVNMQNDADYVNPLCVPNVVGRLCSTFDVLDKGIERAIAHHIDHALSLTVGMNVYPWAVGGNNTTCVRLRGA